ncbi:patatin-like phospholipase family protein [Hydrogenophaga sp.]|uniref:patatin-like phospholipase family protein n=1 Tax=Hydrogenophaga sp. TaxID=1904254 RepID=UPI002ABB1F34|nr:patatin-like phospholipase family protein [Hydrogenophaga sp.]MDZ4400425.1 patatin-like phospholipase family protein [Hydrogenophaga sp.]
MEAKPNDVSSSHRAVAAVDLHTVLHDETGKLSQEQPARLAREGPYTPAPKIGLALSGGGIRSATFSLGVLQALASRNKLASFDYMSTVSGGGYIGSWLSAWIHRSSLHEVQSELKRHGTKAEGDSNTPAADEPVQVAWLRRYSNYLTPRVGLFSLDSLTLVCTWLRNVMLNLIIILGCMGFLFVLPYALLTGFGNLHTDSVTYGFAAAWSGVVAMSLVGCNLWQQSLPNKNGDNWLVTPPGVILSAVLPAVLAAIFASVWVFHSDRTKGDGPVALEHVSVLLLILLGIWLVSTVFGQRQALCSQRKQVCKLARRGKKRWLWQKLFGRKSAFWTLSKETFRFALAGAGGLLAGALMLIGLAAGWRGMADNETYQLVLRVALGPPAVLVTLGVATSVYTGLVGRVFFERSREWWSRLNAWLLIAAVVWALWGALAFFSLPLLQWVHGQLGTWISLLGTGWIGALLTSIFFKKPATASEKTQMRVESVLDLAANVFVIGLLFVAAALASWVLVEGWKKEPSSEDGRAKMAFEYKAAELRIDYTFSTGAEGGEALPAVVTRHMAKTAHLIKPESTLFGMPRSAAALLLLGAIVLLFGLCVDINKFSLHNMYKNRLVRCYLGASNQWRDEQRFTGLDDKDDVPLRNLRAEGARVQRPFHILNTSLNISQGSNLAWQERKAASFVLTPLYCGYSLARTQGDSTSNDEQSWKTQGFCSTWTYAADDPEENGFSLGMAMATSGAAVSPNMGQATRPARAFVLTMFNIRLGRWSPNPRGALPRVPSPRMGFVAMTQELFGYSNEDRDFVYLSDGGHFDNLGLYELVRRRCDVILAVDAGADPKRAFGDLAESIRKCRIDMGVEISLPLADLAAKEGDLRMRSAAGFAEGTVKYGNGVPDGKIVLIKPSMCEGDKEPADLLNYAQQNPPFPQQTTGDQFFGESQFESYRRLGLHITEQCLNAHPRLLPSLPASKFRHKPTSRVDPPSLATRMLRPLVSLWPQTTSTPPENKGSLVDHAVFAAFGSLALLLLVWATGTWMPPAVPGLCWSAASCEAAVTTLLGNPAAPLPFIWDFRYVTLFLDNLFVVAYLGAFVMTFLIATRELPAWCRLKVLLALCLLAVGTACADYLENFSLFSHIAMPSKDNTAHIAQISRLKSVLAGVCLLIALPLQYSIVMALRARWKG